MKINIVGGILGSFVPFISVSCVSKIDEPNVLIILIDDAGYNDFGFMGSKDLQTPNIDKLANSGIILTDGHVSATVSGPSRAGLLTGRYQQRSGYECNLRSGFGLAIEEETIADVFVKKGYATYAIGKWHQGVESQYHPNKRGFEHFYGFLVGGRSYFYRPEKDDKPDAETALQYNGKQIPFNGYLTTVLGNKAAEFIKKENKPFMMYLAFNAVHTPMEADAADLKRFDGHSRQKLAAMTYALDQAIGIVIQALKEKGNLDNTLIFFLSDNGGAHNNQSSNYPLKGFKGNKFEGGHRIPFFVKYGNKLHGKFAGLTSSLDILPTAMSIAGISLDTMNKKLDGVNVFPYLTREKHGNPHDKLFWRKDQMAAMRWNEYKLIRVVGVGERLYNLKSDLNETVDLRESSPFIFKQMMSEVLEWEQDLTNPLLWNEGEWNYVTKEIHHDLMNNSIVQKYIP